MAAGPGAALIGHSFGGAIALETARLAASKRSGASSSTSPGVRVGGLVAADQVELIEQLVGRGDPRQLLLALAGDKDDARWAELRCRSETAQTLGLWRQVVTAVASSSATSSVTRRAISSRVARTSSTGRPLGSSSSQSM